MTIIVFALILQGCFDGCSWETDQELRRELFNECLSNLPQGPRETKYNDWDEVVDSCSNYSYWTSQREMCSNNEAIK